MYLIPLYWPHSLLLQINKWDNCIFIECCLIFAPFLEICCPRLDEPHCIGLWWWCSCWWRLTVSQRIKQHEIRYMYMFMSLLIESPWFRHDVPSKHFPNVTGMKRVGTNPILESGRGTYGTWHKLPHFIWLPLAVNFAFFFLFLILFYRF